MTNNPETNAELNGATPFDWDRAEALYNDRPEQFDPGELEAIAHSVYRIMLPRANAAVNDNKPPRHHLDTIDAETLLGTEFEPIRWVVPGLFVEGLTILGGRPKLGKSWLALNACIAVATGGIAFGKNACSAGDVLFLALEDNDRRLKDRLRVLTPMLIERAGLNRLRTATKSSKIGAGLIEEIDDWRRSAPNPRLVVIDTFQKVRQPKKGNQGIYEADYDTAGALQSYATEHRLAVLVVTHVRKSEADDPLEMINGSNGITGAADSILVLDRDSNGCKLYGRGRDLEEFDYAMKFDNGRWTITGDAALATQSEDRVDALAWITQAGRPVTPTEVADALDLKPDNVRHFLPKMVHAGLLTKTAVGLYTPANSPLPPERDCLAVDSV